MASVSSVALSVERERRLGFGVSHMLSASRLSKILRFMGHLSATKFTVESEEIFDTDSC